MNTHQCEIKIHLSMGVCFWLVSLFYFYQVRGLCFLLVANIIHACIPKYLVYVFRWVKWFGKNPDQFMQRLCTLIENYISYLSMCSLCTFTLKKDCTYISTWVYMHIYYDVNLKLSAIYCFILENQKIQFKKKFHAFTL